MKKGIFILLILIVLILFSIVKFESSENYIFLPKELSTKEIIINNLNKLKDEKATEESYNYKVDKSYQEIIKLGKEAVPILIEMYKNNELDESSSFIAADVIQEISDCNIKQEYDINWDKPEQFFKVWDSLEKIDENTLDKLSHDVIPLLNKYPDMAATIHKSNIKLPELEYMIPQGLTIFKEHIIITAYDKKNQSNSKCFVLNKTGELINIVTLDTNSHVGSIAYDEINNLLWIPENDGKLNAYNADDFLTQQEVNYKYTFEDVGDRLKNYENKLKNLIAYLCVKDNKIFIGSFDNTDKGLVKEYEIVNNENGSVSLNYLNEFKVPPKVQGIEFYEYKNETYMILSCSYGRFNPSYIYIYKYSTETLDYDSSLIEKVTLKLPPMLEQITSLSNRLYVLFESKAKEYENCLEKIGYICVFDLDKIFTKWEPKEKVEIVTQETTESLEDNK